jgi:hypothetical protein
MLELIEINPADQDEYIITNLNFLQLFLMIMTSMCIHALSRHIRVACLLPCRYVIHDTSLGNPN